MARSRSGRSVSRKSTPVSPQKTRSTRNNAGHDNDDDAINVSATAKDRRAASVEGDVSSNVRSMRNRTTTRREQLEQQQQQLSAIPEATAVDDPDNDVDQAVISLVEDDEDEDEDEVDEDGPQEQSSMLSDGTTHTAAEMRALQFDELVDELSNLYSASSKLLGIFDVRDSNDIVTLHDRLQLPASSENTRLKKLLGKFEDVRSKFGTNGYLINQEIVLQVLRQVESWEEVGNGVWRPDAIIQLANLAEIVASLFPKHREAQSVLDPLAHMHQTFPSPFLNRLSDRAAPAYPGESDLSIETLRLALEVRTQYVIKLLVDRERDPNFEPDDITRLVFFSDNSHFRGWDLEGLQDGNGNAPPEVTETIKQRVNAIRSHFSEDPGQPVDFSGLDEAFSWMAFLTNLSKWAGLRAKELKEEVKVRGGADELEEMLRKGVVPEPEPEANDSEEVWREQLLEPEPSAATVTPTLLPALDIMRSAGGANKRSSLDNVHRLIERERAVRDRLRGNRSADGQAAGQVPAQSAPIQSEIDEGANNFEEETLVPTQASRASPRRTQMALRKLESLRKEGNKENVRAGPARFIDPQPGARRISFDDDDEVTRAPVVPSPQKRKRSRSQDEEEDEEDAFQEDKRTAPVQRIRQKPQLRQSPKRRRTEVRQSEDSDAGTGPGSEIGDIEQEGLRRLGMATARHNAARRATSVSSSLDPEHARKELYEQHNRQAKRETKLRKALQVSAVPQRRKPYSLEEEERIIELVEEYGISWTLIKEMDEEHPDGPRLQDRSQVDIKDKCSNMAVDFYKTFRASGTLPHNFEKIPLRTSQRNRLRDLGIDVY